MELTPHGYINVECLLVGALAIFLPRTVVLVLMLVEICGSFVYLICYTYQFSLGSLLASTQYLSLLPVGRITLLFAALATAGASAALVAFGSPRPQGRWRVGVPVILVTLAMMLIALDTFNGQNPELSRDESRAMPRVSISPIVALTARGMLSRAVEASAHNARDLAMDSASAKGIGFLGQKSSAAPPNIVLIVVESWGLPRDPDFADLIDARYRIPKILANYSVSFGTAPFNGLTVPGEARELCHSKFGFGILDLSSAQERRCLPAQLHAFGYQNIAVHGYVGDMFHREDWYRNIGFDQTWFSPNLGKAGLAHCDGAFPGICDGAIAEWIGRELLREATGQPKFIYWVTLNSHLPVPQFQDSPQGDPACSSNTELAGSKPLCSWFRLITAVHESVQQLALETHHRPTVFILVGDHAPPFSDPHLRKLFSDAEVPYVILTPNRRSINRDSGSYERGD